MDTNRRSLLAALGLAPLAIAAARSAHAADAEVCYDPATLPYTQKSRRRSLGYVDVAQDAAKACGGCAFFAAKAAGSSCGTCQLLTGGAVTSRSSCNSFAPKA